MLFSLISGFLFSLSAFSQPVLNQTETYDNLSQYLAYHSEGYIKTELSSDVLFDLSFKNKKATPQFVLAQPDLIHSLWSTDILKFNSKYNATDFASAKKEYFKSLVFNPKKQAYERPYIYLSDWHSLPHPPIRKLTFSNEVYGKQFAPLESQKILTSPLLEVDFQHKLDVLTNTEMTAGNELKLLNNGEVSFKEKVRMVKETKNFFFSVVMVQYCDESSTEIVDAMIEKAQAGVDVRLMMENAWAKLILKKCLAKLRRGGVKVKLVKGFLKPATIFTVSHTKFWVRDGEEGIVGGQNMHDFENSSNGFNQHTRDKDVHIKKGPAVTDLVREYIRIWNQELTNEDPSLNPYKRFVEEKEAEERVLQLRGKDLYATWLNQDHASKIPGVCRLLVQGTKTSGNPGIISTAYLEIMKKTKYSMLVNTPTLRFKNDKNVFYDNSMIVRAILDGAHRGVKVDVVSNGADGGMGELGHQLRLFAKKLRLKGQFKLAVIVEKLDRKLGVMSSRKNWKYLNAMMVNEKVDTWQYFNHIHAKQMLFDHIMTSTGSFNLDSHSHKNHESTLICFDQKLAAESLLGFISDISNSVPMPN